VGACGISHSASRVTFKFAFFRCDLFIGRCAPSLCPSDVDGDDGFHLDGGSPIAKISRDTADLVKQMIGPHHQYPDGAPLSLGTMFAPIQDRDTPGKGFTHKTGDIVTVSSEKLGTLINRMQHSTDCPPWTFGSSHLFRNLAKRGLI
jgi:fumarylacetoacetate (FAA) hydrolase family protein